MKSRTIRVARGALAKGLLLAAALSAPEPAAAQVPDRTQATADSVAAAARVSPGGAFVRAMLVPGWGHASLGTYNRGGFYFAVQTVTGYTLLRTVVRLGEASERLDFREDLLRADLAAQGVVDPEEVETALEDDPVVADLRGLVDARERQREDLIAFGIFLIFLSGVDAFVSGHLANFPEPLEVQPSERAPGRMEISFELPVGR